MSKKSKSKKVKSQIGKLIDKSDSENDDEHELSFYMNDRVKLMKEVLKIIKPKQIKSMAPDCIKDSDIEEINSMLLEELLGISNKRLKHIFNGENLAEDSSSTDPEEEKPVDVISLDDVSDDDFAIIEVDSGSGKPSKLRDKHKGKQIKKEKLEKSRNKEPLQEENLMSVLELLELQARARAIRSQLMLEASKKNKSNEVVVAGDSDNDDVIIAEMQHNEEIVIESSDSESGKQEKESTSKEGEGQNKKITLIRDRFGKPKTPEPETSNQDDVRTEGNSERKEETNKSEANATNIEHKEGEAHDEDEIILIVDQEEMAGIIGN